MNHAFHGWDAVARQLQLQSEGQTASSINPAASLWTLDNGQCRALDALARNLPKHGMVLADEVGMGKTRIAVALTRAVVQSGGRVAILVPPGLGYQWHDELQHGGVACLPILRSLWQYLQGFDCHGAQASHWFEQSVVLISHSFSNWRLGESSASWRWTLLPEVLARWRQSQPGGRAPWGAKSLESHGFENVRCAAKAIVEAAMTARQGAAAQVLDQLIELTPWPGALGAGEYAQGTGMREHLERAVGLGLGHFDLVVVDEAHKSRGQESGLSRLLERLTLTCQTGSTDKTGRRLAMTATPVELDVSQWADTLERVGVQSQALIGVIERYAVAARAVRACPTHPDERARFGTAAGAFQTALEPYLVRRDKRESVAVQAFKRLSGSQASAYRDERDIRIAPASLSVSWRQALCAAESISLLSTPARSQALQRLRLTIGNGHGILSALDECQHDEQDAATQLANDEEVAAADTSDSEPVNEMSSVSAERLRWWQGALRASFPTEASASLYFHPGIRAAVRAIEEADSQDEKVLVFGRFTRPMKALVELLNARRMLKDLAAGRSWPQSTLPDAEWLAVQAAHTQLGLPGEPDRSVLAAQMADQYRRLENARERSRTSLVERLSEGLAKQVESSRLRRLLDALRSTPESVAPLTRALTEVLGDRADIATASEWAEAFVDLVGATADREEGDGDGDGFLDADEATQLWPLLVKRWTAEFSGAEGSFARRMHGDTPLPTRRMLQIAFNRPNSFPRVLVAQSMVGREGLNLHKACRIVVLLHPEWNPGIVEQQIGRVDRVGSRWESALEQAMRMGAEPSALPRIQVRPIIVEGTYDEHNWAVLRERWDAMRSQLHGVVIPASEVGSDPAMASIAETVNAMAPNFSPLKRH